MFFSTGEQCYIHASRELPNRIDGTSTFHHVLTMARVESANEDGTLYTLVARDGERFTDIPVTSLIPLTERDYAHHRNPSRR